ncbi:hypothetical protein KDW99_08760 [Marinomonas rhizomae]|uniref:hypothetical protein n=1 Tax=Marinomonas rhizomae TaxID=491948 RepID=UPI0021036606|nr:hypothetical protein [Marinomonas rhizomae]UTW01198.1 hypothetical protein KDW99_08760 [Marinomonas rhizomae]
MSIIFELFRFQLLPKNRFAPQVDWLNELMSVEELIARKNEFFFQSLLSVVSDKPSLKNIKIKSLYCDEDFMILKLARSRQIERETEDFKGEVLDDWPSTLVVIWNHPDRQLIAVQKRRKAFKKCIYAVNLLTTHINKRLATRQLVSEFEPLFESNEFWSLLKRHEGKVTNVEFEFITPNMASMSKSLSEDIKSFSKATNATKSKLKFEADKDSALLLEKDNPMLSGLVDYHSKGGGNIKINVTGLKKTLSTSDTVREVSLEGLEIEGNEANVINALKELIND